MCLRGSILLIFSLSSVYMKSYGFIFPKRKISSKITNDVFDKHTWVSDADLYNTGQTLKYYMNFRNHGSPLASFSAIGDCKH